MDKHRIIQIYVLSPLLLFSLSHVQLFATPWTAACQASLSITNSWSLCKLMCIKLVMPSNQLILSRPLLLLPSIFPNIRVFSNESVLHIRWPNYWSFSFSISSSNEYPGLISFRIDWFNVLAVQGIFKCLLQHHNSKASVPQYSAFFMVQLSFPPPGDLPNPGIKPTSPALAGRFLTTEPLSHWEGPCKGTNPIKRHSP